MSRSIIEDEPGSAVARAGETVLTNARLVLADEVVRGSIQLAAGVIRAIDAGRSHVPGALDLAGDYLLPGLIDLHTDALERHYQPRQGVYWDAVSAAVSHDTQIIGSGITTVFDSLTLGAAEGWDSRAETIQPIVAGLRAACEHGMLKAEHLLHMRCEVTHPGILGLLEAYLGDPRVRMVSLMDHAPGDRQSPDIDDYRRRYLKVFEFDLAAVERHVAELLHASATYGPGNRRALAEAARAHGIPLASHDDARPEHVEEARELGAALTEFPTTQVAAAHARQLGLAVLMGSPNLVRGGSHSGNVRAADLALAGTLDILSSDYIPSSLLPAAFMLHKAPFDLSMPAAVASATLAPAAAAGLADRGQLAPGLRADLVQVSEIAGRPLVRAVWAAGVRVA